MPGKKSLEWPHPWLYNLHKSLEEGSQGKFPWNISLAKKKKKQRLPQRHLPLTDLSAALSNKGPPATEQKCGIALVPLPAQTFQHHHPKPNCTLVRSCAWCSAGSKARPHGQKTRVCFCINDLLKTTMYCKENTSLAKGKESTPTKHLEGSGPEPALQIHYLMKSRNAPTVENYPHSTKEETEARRASITCPWLTVTWNWNADLLTPKSLSSPPNCHRDASSCPISATYSGRTLGGHWIFGASFYSSVNWGNRAKYLKVPSTPKIHYSQDLPAHIFLPPPFCWCDITYKFSRLQDPKQSCTA